MISSFQTRPPDDVSCFISEWRFMCLYSREFLINRTLSSIPRPPRQQGNMASTTRLRLIENRFVHDLIYFIYINKRISFGEPLQTWSIRAMESPHKNKKIGITWVSSYAAYYTDMLYRTTANIQVCAMSNGKSIEPIINRSTTMKIDHRYDMHLPKRRQWTKWGKYLLSVTGIKNRQYVHMKKHTWKILLLPCSFNSPLSLPATHLPASIDNWSQYSTIKPSYFESKTDKATHVTCWVLTCMFWSWGYIDGIGG